MKPWREIAVPHPDVLEGTFQQSEFAADISAVRDGKATHEYQDPAAFFQRTFITQGMRLLLTQVALRLNGKGGEPVIQLQTAFGGDEGYAMVRNADHSGISPGKEVLQALLERFAPCVILVDELIAYIRQFADGQTLTGGTYESNMSFVQSLTEAVKLVPNPVLLASLPESDPKRDKPESNVQVGGPRGLRALRALLVRHAPEFATRNGRPQRSLRRTSGRT